nr:MAG: hypothetical protein [Porcellio scaber clopovirus]
MDSIEHCAASPSLTPELKKKKKMIKNLNLDVMKPPCNPKCPHRCSSKIDFQRRKEIFSNFQNLETKKLQQNFIENNHRINLDKPKTNKKRRQIIAFRLYDNDNQEQWVCRTFFRNTIGLTVSRMRTFMKRILHNLEYKTTKDLPIEEENPFRKYFVIRADIRKHIASIPKIKSPGTMISTQQQLQTFIDGSKFIKDLHQDYVKKCLDLSRPYGSLKMYRNIFTNELKISRLKSQPKQKNKIQMNNSNNSVEGKEEIDVKTLGKNDFKWNNNKKGENDNHPIVAHFKLQIPPFTCPRSKDPLKFYYTPKFEAYNFTVRELKKSNELEKSMSTASICFFWHECDGGINSSEIGSCLLKFIETKLIERGLAVTALSSSSSSSFSSSSSSSSSYFSLIAPAATPTDKTEEKENVDFIFYSNKLRVSNEENQQKQFNHAFISAYICACLKWGVNSVTHKILEDDDENECDRFHSALETRINNSLQYYPIYQPGEYITLIAGIDDEKESGEIRHLDYGCFVNFETIRESLGINVEENEALKNLDDAKVIKVEKKNPRVILYKTTFEEDEPFKEVSIDSERFSKLLSPTPENSIIFQTLYKDKQYASREKIDAIIDSLKDEREPHNYAHKQFYNGYSE